MCDGERTLDYTQRAHVEDVTPRFSARQTVIDEIEQRLLYLSGMLREKSEIAAERGFERLGVAQRTNSYAERFGRGIDPRRERGSRCGMGAKCCWSALHERR